MNTHTNTQSENELYAGPEFDELPIDRESLDPALQCRLPEFFFGPDYLPKEVTWVLLATLKNAVERISLRFNQIQIQTLQAFRTNHKLRNAFLRKLHGTPDKLNTLRAALASLYEHREVKTPPWAQAENAKAFQEEIMRRNRAVIEVYIEIYEYAFQRLSGESMPYIEKPIDLSGRPIEFPTQEYPVDPEIDGIMKMTQIQNLAVMEMAMREDHSIRPSSLRSNVTFSVAPKDGLEGLTPMERIEDEMDFRNTIRLASHIVHTKGRFFLTANLAQPLLSAMKRKFPKKSPMDGFKVSIAMASPTPASIITMPIGILICAISPQELREVVMKNMPNPAEN